MLAPMPALAMSLNSQGHFGFGWGRGDDERHVRVDDDADVETHTVDIACMQRAVDAREVSVRTATTVYISAWLAALDARAAALHAAWGMTDREARRNAIVKAWMDYKNAKRSAEKTFRESKRTAWQTFRTAAKQCGGGAEMDMGMSIDAKL